jgi:hypothetical protein
VFGYRNVDVTRGVDAHGRPLRSHVDRTIDAAEAVVVRRIFDLYAGGHGLKRLAKLLNAEGAMSPRPFVRRSDKIAPPVGHWTPSTLRTVLARPVLRRRHVEPQQEEIVMGQGRPTPRPDEDRIEAAREDLRIIPEEIWTRVHSRVGTSEGRSRSGGRPPKTDTQNLLSGIASCGVCGGGLAVETGGRKDGRVSQYVCHRRRHSGRLREHAARARRGAERSDSAGVEEHAPTIRTPSAFVAMPLIWRSRRRRSRSTGCSARSRLKSRRAINTDGGP